MKLGSRTAEGYVLLMGTAFLLLTPWFAPGGGYGSITGFKAWLYLVLTGLFLLLSLGDLPRCPGFLRSPPRLLAMGLGLLCLLSALCSPWRETAFFGGSRREGYVHIALYLLSFLLLSARPLPRPERALALFAAGILAEEAICFLQLGGRNVLGLYPPGLGWADANLRYAGSYLGTLGNAGQTGTVLAAAGALFYLNILRRGGKARLLLLPLLPGTLLLGIMDVTGPMLALCAVMLLVPIPLVRTGRELCRWVWLSALTCCLLLYRLLAPGQGLVLSLMALAAFAGERLLPPEGRARVPALCLPGLLAALAFLFVFTYDGWYTPLREASALLHGRAGPDMGSGRWMIWTQVLAAAREHLWLGTGPDTLALRDLVPYTYEAAEAGRTVTLAIDAAHCEVLQTLVCCGLPAALCHLGLLVWSALAFFRSENGRHSCAGGAFCYALCSLTGISMCLSAPIFWILLALSCTEGGAFDADEQK